MSGRTLLTAYPIPSPRSFSISILYPRSTTLSVPLPSPLHSIPFRLKGSHSSLLQPEGRCRCRHTRPTCPLRMKETRKTIPLRTETATVPTRNKDRFGKRADIRGRKRWVRKGPEHRTIQAEKRLVGHTACDDKRGLAARDVCHRRRSDGSPRLVPIFRAERGEGRYGGAVVRSHHSRRGWIGSGDG